MRSPRGITHSLEKNFPSNPSRFRRGYLQTFLGVRTSVIAQKLATAVWDRLGYIHVSLRANGSFPALSNHRQLIRQRSLEAKLSAAQSSASSEHDWGV